MRPYSPGGELNALASAQKGFIPSTPSSHRLGLGLPGYLIPFAPLAFAPQRQCRSRKPPSPPVFLRISAHFTATPGIPLPSPELSLLVSRAVPRLSRGLSHGTWRAAYAPFTPSNSEQRLPPLYYRGCWHRVSRGFLHRYSQHRDVLGRVHSSRSTGVYDPKAFILHAALLRQGFPHCEKFPTAASRRSLGRVSVPVWPSALSGRLPIVALVGRYPAN